MEKFKTKAPQRILRCIKKSIFVFTAASLICVSVPIAAKADSSKVVTLGANLSDEQKESMYKYFGTTADDVDTIEVTNHRLGKKLTAVLMLSRLKKAESR